MRGYGSPLPAAGKQRAFPDCLGPGWNGRSEGILHPGFGGICPCRRAKVQEASALRINGAEIPLAAGSLWDTAGYEALWEQWVHITGVKATQEGVCLRGSRELYDSVQSVSLMCGEEKLACKYDVSAGTSGSDTEEHWYKPEKAFDVKNVTAVEINGVEIPKASFLPSCGYEALWQAGMDISEIAIITPDFPLRYHNSPFSDLCTPAGDWPAKRTCSLAGLHTSCHAASGGTNNL